MNFPTGQGSFSIVSNQFGRFPGNSVKSVINKWVHDVHCFFANTNFWVNLLQHFVNIERKCLDSSLMSPDGCSSSRSSSSFSWGHFWILNVVYWVNLKLLSKIFREIQIDKVILIWIQDFGIISLAQNGVKICSICGHENFSKKSKKYNI